MSTRSSILRFFSAATMLFFAGTATAQEIDWKAVGKALGKEGSVQTGGIYRVGLPRSDLKVTLDGLALKPSFALGGWLAFEPMGTHATVMGDLVLLDSETGPVMERLLKSGIEVTALHNHLLRSSPPTLYMHVLGQGDPVELAGELHDALAASKTPFGASAPLQTMLAIDAVVAKLDGIMEAQAKANAGVLQYSFPRAEAITENGMPVPPAMGSATAINFQLSGSDKAAITGDFVLIGAEVMPVEKTLREHGIEVTALHSHMIDEEPRLYFMHFWANGNVEKLAHGLRAALNQVNLKRS